MFCENCGKNIPENSEFCEECGFKVSGETELKLQDESEVLEIAEVLEKKPLKINKKALMGIVIFLLILMVSGISLNAMSNPDKTVDQFIQAMNSKDFEALSNVSEVSDRNIELTEQNIQPMFELYAEKGRLYKNINDSLEEDLRILKMREKLEGNKIVNLSYDNYILFKKYKVSINTGSAKFTSNLSNTRMSCSLGETKIASQNESAVLSGLIPGKYEITAVSDQEIYGKFNKRETLMIEDSEEQSVNVEFDVCSLNLMKPDVQVATTSIYINDKKLEKPIDNGYGYEIKPLPTGAVIKMECKTPKGTALSYSYAVNGSDIGDKTIYPDFSLPISEMKNQYYKVIYWDNIWDSSRLYEENFDYTSYNLNDDNIATPWVEGVEGYGKGESIEFSSLYEREIVHIDINNGYAKNTNLFNKNASVKKLKLEFSDGTEIVKELQKTPNTQDITLNRPIRASWMRLTIIDVYPGTKFEDTCISEVRVYEA